ncbi:thiopurine S-methyltransferase-like [Penaeus japonicus]|uniref:thiopurine S-methyltransferase-like n=1 Tax=Penaeus japonicus TaxID=27405 RepID=UPI001C71679C|nr:thiopurine S-methyltransferase-like [Penaeus japonicus]
MSSEERVKYWESAWDNGRTQWHASVVNFALQSFGHLLLPSPQRRVLVPLCGKTVDMKWFYDNGHSVVGIEGVEMPVKEFYEENGIPYTTEELPWGKLYKSKDQRIQLYCCDLFQAKPEVLGKFDAVWDRGSLVAIYEEDRERYSQFMKAVLAPDFRYLVNLMQYRPNEEFSGPPRNVPNELVLQLFGDVCELQVLETLKWSKEEGPWYDYGMQEVVALLTPKK